MKIFSKNIGVQLFLTSDNKFSALNSAVWSGGSFIYVPPGVKVDTPLQAYFRINSENMGQFERTLIIVDEGACCSLCRRMYSSCLHNKLTSLVLLLKSLLKKMLTAVTQQFKTGRTTYTT